MRFINRLIHRMRKPWYVGLGSGLLFILVLSGCIQRIAPTVVTEEDPAVSEESPTNIPEPTLIPYQSPEWFENAVLYEIFVRSYADSDGDGIGDLRGIQERLDHIESLRVDVIWLMPIYPSPSDHGYDVTDFFEVNPEYGTKEDLIALVEAVHSRGMKIILDFVPSHLSNENPLFAETYANPEAEKAEWFVFTNKTNTQYANFGGNNEMPRFNHYNPEVVDYLIEAALFWIDLDGDRDYGDGIDGFRVDNATFPPQEFFIDLRQAVKTANPEALLLGETWVTDIRSLSIYYQDQFDALFDFPLYSVVEGQQNFNGDGLLAGKGHPSLISSLMEEEEERIPEGGLVVRFFSNHDTNRIAAEVNGDLERQKLAATFLASLPGPVMVYYGEEIGMLGQKGRAPYWDNYRREPMDWFAGESGPHQTSWFKVEDRWNAPRDGISVEEQETDPNSLLNHYRLVLNLRRENEALGQGGYDLLFYKSSGIGAFVLARTSEDGDVVAIYNFSEEPIQVTVEEFPFSADALVDLLTGEMLTGAQAGETYAIELPPAGAVWLAAP